MRSASQIKADIDDQVTNKTEPNSISNVDVGNRMDELADLASPFDPVLFTNQSILSISWDASMKARFGMAAQFVVETLDDDGKYRQKYGLEIYPDDIANTTVYHIDLGGGLKSGRYSIK